MHYSCCTLKVSWDQSSSPDPTNGKVPAMAEPARKKTKLDSSLSSPAPSLRLDFLSAAAVENIVRHLSAKPRAQQWEKSVARTTILKLLNTSGDTCAAARILFTKLELTKTFYSEALPETIENFERMVISLTCNACVDLCLFVAVEGYHYCCPKHEGFASIGPRRVQSCGGVKGSHLTGSNGVTPYQCLKGFHRIKGAARGSRSR